MQDKANVYVKLKLLIKGRKSRLVDTGSEVTLIPIPRDLIKLFRSLDMNLSMCRVFAANNTPI